MTRSDICEDDLVPELQAPRFRLTPFSQIIVGSQAVYLVRGMIPRVGLTVIYGPPKSGKSLLTFDIVMHVALGWEYRHRRVKQGSVVYLALEGASGFRARVEAFRRYFPVDDNPPFHLIDATLALVSDQGDLIASIWHALAGDRPSAVVIDTLNRSFVGSESSDQDMTAYIRAADALKVAFDCAVIVVHHSGLDASRPRGHTSLLGAADACLAVKKGAGENTILTVEAMKDGPIGDEITSRLHVVQVGYDEDGEPITSCVVLPTERDTAETTKAGRTSKPTKSGGTALKAIRRAVNEVGVIPPASDHLPSGVKCVTIAQWRDFAYRMGISASDEPRARQQAFKRGSDDLISGGQVTVWDPYAWTLKP